MYTDSDTGNRLKNVKQSFTNLVDYNHTTNVQNYTYLTAKTKTNIFCIFSWACKNSQFI